MTAALTSRPGPLRRTVRRAFTDPQPGGAPAYLVDGCVRHDLPEWESGGAAVRLAILVPTAFARASQGGARETLASLGRALQRLAEIARPIPEILLVVAAQWESCEEERDLRDVLCSLERWWDSFETGAEFLAVTIERPSKLHALNSCVDALDAFGADFVAWHDDDIVLDPEYYAELLDHLPAAGRVMGGSKRAVPDRSRFSRRWAAYKNRVEPTNAYPHGCAMLMRRATFGDGIPLRYRTDDHFFLLRSMSLHGGNVEGMAVVESARVFVPAPNGALEVVHRVARNFRNVLRVLADAPDSTVRAFLGAHLFPHLRLPRTGRELATASYWKGNVWHTMKFVFWFGVVTDVLIRGATRRPHGTGWYSAPYPASLTPRAT